MPTDILCRKWIYFKLRNLILYILFHSYQHLNIDLSIKKIKKCALFQLMVIDILISPDNTGTKMQVMCLIDLINNDSLSYYVKRSSQNYTVEYFCLL